MYITYDVITMIDSKDYEVQVAGVLLIPHSEEGVIHLASELGLASAAQCNFPVYAVTQDDKKPFLVV